MIRQQTSGRRAIIDKEILAILHGFIIHANAHIVALIESCVLCADLYQITTKWCAKN